MKPAYAFPGITLVCALLLPCFPGVSPAMAQSTTMTLCSRNDPAFHVTGALKRLDEMNYVLLTRAGTQSYNKDDFYSCPATTDIIAPVCPSGQISSGNRCVCQANLIMRGGQCVAAQPPENIPAGKQLPACTSQETLTIQGSSTIGLGIMPSLIAGFANANSFRLVINADDKDRARAVFQLRRDDSGVPCFVITVVSTGSDTAKDGIVDGVAQIGMSSREYTDGEIAVLARAGRMSTYQRIEIEHIAGLDAVGIVVNRNSSIASLELCQIAKIFSGKIRDWRELRGAAGPIRIHVRTGTSGTYETFREKVMESCHETLASDASTHGTYEDLLDAVEADAAAIGFAPVELLGARHPSVRSLNLGSSCGVEQTFSAFSVKSEDYPLARRLYLFTPIALKGYARAFEDFIETDARVDDLVRRASAIDLNIDERADDHAGSLNARETAADPRSRDRFNHLIRNGRRLSITFRFASGSDRLDTRARQDVVRLADELRKTRPAAVYLAGFSDGAGSVPVNRALAMKRADTVRRELLNIVPDMAASIRAEGFGKILPVACNDTPLGEEKNRRVEVVVVR